ncbi:MAG: hypothetical protein HOE80_01170 [Candidatus Magasanikbacteria bacterium]|nr:hypothetical protein [Candidatus Magasanikbacteria bacterium]MBT4071313.1 hypothetical protein [Candidatus Magasanikbacteria bacterium]
MLLNTALFFVLFLSPQIPDAPRKGIRVLTLKVRENYERGKEIRREEEGRWMKSNWDALRPKKKK